jgi:hypothetical protein
VKDLRLRRKDRVSVVAREDGHRAPIGERVSPQQAVVGEDDDRARGLREAGGPDQRVTVAGRSALRDVVGDPRGGFSKK